MGRAVKFDEDWKIEFLQLVSGYPKTPDQDFIRGRSLNSIVREANMPSDTFVYEELDRDPVFAADYARACATRAENIFENMSAVAEGAGLTHERIAKAKLIIDTDKWQLSKMNSAKYGNKLAVDHTVDLTEQSEEQLQARAEQLAARMGIKMDLTGKKAISAPVTIDAEPVDEDMPE